MYHNNTDRDHYSVVIATLAEILISGDAFMFQGYSGCSTTIGSTEQQLASAYAATHLESMCQLDIDSIPHVHRMSGIICTIGVFICH